MKKAIFLLLFLCLTVVAQQPAAVVNGGLNVTGAVNATGAIKSDTGIILPDGTALTDLSVYRTRIASFLIGCDSCQLLSEFNDQKVIFINQFPQDLKFQSVVCITDAGTVTINLIRDDGTPANMLSVNLACTVAGATSPTTGAFVAGEDAIKVGEKLGFELVSTSGQAHRVIVSIRSTL